MIEAAAERFRPLFSFLDVHHKETLFDLKVIFQFNLKTNSLYINILPF